MEIKSISVANFKGIKSFRLEFGQETNIVARNGSGKSSIMHAFRWLLFLGKDDVYPRIDKYESTKQTIVKLELVVNGEDLVLERRSSPVFENGRKTNNKGLFFIDDLTVLEKDFKKFIDEKFPYRVLMQHDLVENMKWADLRILIMTILDLQDRATFVLADGKPDEELNKLVGQFGLSKTITELNRRAKDFTAQIDRCNTAIEIAKEIGKGKTIDEYIAKQTESKKALAVKFEQTNQKVAKVENAVLENEKRLEDELRRMLGGDIEVVLRNELLNGNIKPSCSIMKDGVDFDQLSYSQRTLAQVSLWRELCRMAYVKYPLWLDNYESIDGRTDAKFSTMLHGALGSNYQIIRLCVGNKEISGLIKLTRGDF